MAKKKAKKAKAPKRRSVKKLVQVSKDPAKQATQFVLNDTRDFVVSVHTADTGLGQFVLKEVEKLVKGLKLPLAPPPPEKDE